MRNHFTHVITIFFSYYLSETISELRKCPHQILGSIENASHDEIIALHNHCRLMAVNGSIGGQPKASPGSVNLLKWDQTLEQLALEVSKTCDFKHVDMKSAKFPNGLGQNLYRSCSNKRRKVNWNKAIGDWFNEHTKYTFGDEPSALTGHYTQNGKPATEITKWICGTKHLSLRGDEFGKHFQVVWGQSKFVGCAHTEYFQGNSTKVPYCILYVCHYDPRGNVRGEPPYKPAG